MTPLLFSILFPPSYKIYLPLSCSNSFFMYSRCREHKKTMRIKKIYIVLGGFLFLLAIVPISLFLIKLSTNKVEILNQDPHFTVTFQETPLLSNQFNEWGIFENSFSTEEEQRKIKKIQVVFTDDPQSMYRLFLDPNKSPIQSYNWTIRSNGVLEMKIYLEPGYHKQLSSSQLALSVNGAFIHILYNLSHIDEIKTTDLPRGLLTVFDLYKNESEIPFSVLKR